jgi:hypothetical protein
MLIIIKPEVNNIIINKCNCTIKYDTIDIDITTYSATINQCDDNPKYTADGTRTDLNHKIIGVNYKLLAQNTVITKD